MCHTDTAYINIQVMDYWLTVSICYMGACFSLDFLCSSLKFFLCGMPTDFE